MAKNIGIISVLHGTATAESAEGIRTLHQGDSVFEDDVITTLDDSSLEIRFADNTILAQDSQSIVNLDQYTFDPEGNDSSLLFQLTQGTFRTVTGEIVDQNPDGFHLESPLATIGIRGTSTASHIPAPGSADPTEQHLVLVYDGKAVSVTLKSDGTFKLMSESGQKIDVTALSSSDVQIMTRAEFEYYQQLSPDNIDDRDPVFDSPDEIEAQDSDAGSPVAGPELQSAAQEDADENGADENDADKNGADETSADESFDEDDPVADLEEEDFALVGEGGSEAGDETLDGGAGSDDLGESSGIFATDTGETFSATMSEAAQETMDLILSMFTAPAMGPGQDLIPTTTSTPDPISTSTIVSGTFDLSTLSTSITNVTVEGPTPTISTSGNSIAGGNTMTVDGSALTTALNFNGSSVTSSGYFDVKGGSAGDTIKGSNHNPTGDMLYGNDGVDSIYGYEGQDTIYGGAGNDHLYGDDSTNTAGTGSDDDAIYGGDGNDTIFGDTGDDTLYGEADDDTISGNDGNDTLEGGAGVDTLNGNAGADILKGGADIDTINGGAGNDTIIGGQGNDTLNGDGDIDTLDYSQETGTGGINGSLNSNITDTFGNTDSTSGFEKIIGTTLADTITVNGQTVTGGGGVDTLAGSGDVNSILSFLGETGGGNVSCNLENNNVTDTFGNSETISGFNNVAGSNQNDTLFDNTNANKIWGHNGSDTIVIRYNTANTVDAGAGNDSLQFSGNASGTYDGGAGTDTLSVSANTTLSAANILSNFETATLNLNSSLTVSGGAFTAGSNIAGNASTTGQTLTFESSSAQTIKFTTDGWSLTNLNGYTIAMLGGSNADTFEGHGSYAINFEGKGGADTLTSQHAGDVLSYASSATGVTVDLSANTASGGDAAGDTISGFTHVTGGGGADTLKGTSAANTITGGSGNDHIYGLNGADTLNGGSGDDTFHYTCNLELDSSEQLDGGTGSADAIEVTGNYTYDFTSITPTAIEELHLLNNATIVFTAAQVQTADFSKVTGQVGTSESLKISAGGSVDLTSLTSLTFSDFSDTGASNDFVKLVAGSGPQTLVGTNVAGVVDIIQGGSGGDTLTGGNLAKDIFYYANQSYGSDTITDFTTGTDKFMFYKHGSFSNLHGTTLGTDWFFANGSYTANGANGTDAGPTFFLDDTISSAQKLYYDPDGSGTSATTYYIAHIGASGMNSGDIEVVTDAI